MIELISHQDVFNQVAKRPVVADAPVCLNPVLLRLRLVICVDRVSRISLDPPDFPTHDANKLRFVEKPYIGHNDLASARSEVAFNPLVQAIRPVRAGVAVSSKLCAPPAHDLTGRAWQIGILGKCNHPIRKSAVFAAADGQSRARLLFAESIDQGIDIDSKSLADFLAQRVSKSDRNVPVSILEDAGHGIFASPCAANEAND